MQKRNNCILKHTEKINVDILTITGVINIFACFM